MLLGRVGREFRREVLPEVPPRDGRGQPGLQTVSEVQDVPGARRHRLHQQHQGLGGFTGRATPYFTQVLDKWHKNSPDIQSNKFEVHFLPLVTLKHQEEGGGAYLLQTNSLYLRFPST